MAAIDTKPTNPLSPNALTILSTLSTTAKPANAGLVPKNNYLNRCLA